MLGQEKQISTRNRPPASPQPPAALSAAACGEDF